jgi:hypothetical protein
MSHRLIFIYLIDELSEAFFIIFFLMKIKDNGTTYERC